MIRSADKKSPREAVEFVLQLLKYNDNNGNPYSDVFWIGALVQSIGELELGQQSISFLPSLLKRIDRLLQFDRLMPSYNGVLMISCIRTLTQVALKLSEFIPLDRVVELIKPFRESETMWKVRIEASKALLDLELHCKGIDATLTLFIKYLEEEPSLRGQAKLSAHVTQRCQMRSGSNLVADVKSENLVALLRLLESSMAFNNVVLRHYLFCILQVLAGRSPTLFGVPRDETLRMGHAETCSELKNIFAALVKQSKPIVDGANILSVESTGEITNPSHFEPPAEVVIPNSSHMEATVDADLTNPPQLVAPTTNTLILQLHRPETAVVAPEVSKEANIVSDNHGRGKPVIKIKVKHSAASSRAEDVDNASTSCYQNFDEVNSSFHDQGSRMTASIGSAKVPIEGKELQCTADSSKKKKKDEERKRKRGDPEYLERKRKKKMEKKNEKKKKKELEKETSSLVVFQSTEVKSARNLQIMKDEIETGLLPVELDLKQGEVGYSNVVTKIVGSRGDPSEATRSSHKFRIKIKNQTLNNKSQGM